MLSCVKFLFGDVLHSNKTGMFKVNDKSTGAICEICFTHFRPMFHLNTPRKHQKTKSFLMTGFLMIPEGIHSWNSPFTRREEFDFQNLSQI